MDGQVYRVTQGHYHPHTEQSNVHCFLLTNFTLLQIYTDFEEIRQEIEAETERLSGTNKVC